MKKRLSNVMAIVMALGMVFMAGNVWAEGTGTETDNLALTFELDNPPSITISALGAVTTVAGETDMNDAGTNWFNQTEIVEGTWEINSNSAFTIAFTGSHKDDDGNDSSIPVFHKQDVDAKGDDVAGQYDHLVTSYGVEIVDEYASGGVGFSGTADNWGDKGAPTGAPAALVNNTGTPPQTTIGTIAPADDDGKCLVRLWAKGEASQDVQSGDYKSQVTLTVTLDETEGGSPY